MAAFKKMDYCICSCDDNDFVEALINLNDIAHTYVLVDNKNNIINGKVKMGSLRTRYNRGEVKIKEVTDYGKEL